MEKVTSGEAEVSNEKYDGGHNEEHQRKTCQNHDGATSRHCNDELRDTTETRGRNREHSMREQQQKDERMRRNHLLGLRFMVRMRLGQKRKRFGGLMKKHDGGGMAQERLGAEEWRVKSNQGFFFQLRLGFHHLKRNLIRT